MICCSCFRELFYYKKLRGAQWHSRGQRFDPAYLHQTETEDFDPRFFCLVETRVRAAADLFRFNQNPPPAGFPAFTAGKVSGSIPQLSTN